MRMAPIISEKYKKCKIFNKFVFALLICNFPELSSALGACDKSRKVFEGVGFGQISHGLVSNYTQDSHCEWLIKADNESQFITLKFHSLKTECSYDYLFIYDGSSYESQLIGSFSGQTYPDDVTAYSGFMLVMLYSDTNYVLDGFRADFSVTNCLNNCSSHGLCQNHSCLCTGDYVGLDCSIKGCDCGDEENRGSCNKDRCECRNNFSGQSCTLHQNSFEPSQWHWLTNSSFSFSHRAAHTAIYHEATDSVYIFGGYDLNNVLGSLEIFRFNSSTWENEDGEIVQTSRDGEVQRKSALKDLLLEEFPTGKQELGVHDKFWFQAALLSHVQAAPLVQESPKKVNRSESVQPDPRYSHAACRIGDAFLIYGGKLANGNLSNELWLYNMTLRTWSLRAAQSKLNPSKLARHTLTFVDSNGFAYLFGGALVNGDFSSRMFRIKLVENSSEDQWEEVFARGGKLFDYRVVAHTTNYYPDTDSLIIYGGIIASVARLSKLSDRIFSFNIIDQHWTEIFYPKTILREMSIPRERAFHSATIAGNYLIVFGGYSHRHNKEEICYDNQMYLYHLDCHAWINQEALGAKRTNYPKKQGVFAHATALRRNNTLLVVGGFHGNINNDFLAFTLPDMMIPSKNLTESEKCTEYKSSTECIANPQCGWCSSDASCYGRTMSNCFTNLQTTRCPGICSALRDCQSCLIHGSSDSSAQDFNKLPIGKCTWCVQNTKCHQKNDYEPCGESDSVEKIGYQWWGRSGIEIQDKHMCTKLDKPPGLLHLKYFHPFDWRLPDYVNLINSTLIDFTSGTLISSNESPQNGDVISRLHGYLHLPAAQENRKEVLKVCGSYAQVTLKASTNSESVVAANFTADQNLCVISGWDKWELQKVLIDLQARRRLTNQNAHQHFPSKVGLQNNATTKAFTFEFLEPFSNGSCHQYENCLLCLSDNACGWCDLKSKCVSRNINETAECRLNDHWRYLILQPNQCENCSNFISCEDCTSSKSCEWWSEETRCVRAKRSPNGIKDVAKCPSPCYLRTNCSNCLNEKGRCVWCEEKQTCFSFAVYTSEFQFGLCREWIDQSLSPPHTETKSVEHHQCKSCSSLKNCSTCLRSLGCGWCFFQDSPIDGACVQGDFNSSTIDCGDVLDTTNATLYNYESCPDVDECGLGIDDCHENADCTNYVCADCTHGSFSCKCRRGFIGDGRQRCDKTCIETCHHGTCSNYPSYLCICDLGWTGVDCSQNCGCNNHSTCRDGLGTCDECMDNTEGEHCEKCVRGSFGNATTTGCIQCNCNGHGDEKLGNCHPITGQCFCLDNTEGINCELCAKSYYGEPQNGGQCYLQCQSRTMLKTLRSQGIGSFESSDGTEECLWILKLNESVSENSLIQLEIEEKDMNVSCYNNAIYIYNNIPELPQAQMQKKLSSVVCRDSSFPKIIEESKTGQLTVYFHRSQNNEGFNAVIKVLNCELGTCVEPHTCDDIGQCVCPVGFRGFKCEIEVCPFNCSFSMSQGNCDLINNRCNCLDGFGGDDCSRIIRPTSVIMAEVFNTEIVVDNLMHLKKTLPRFGHTVNGDRRGFLWIFGGFSLVNGALNDIRQFDTKNHTWMQVTVDGSDSKMPVGRYFHASEVSKQSIYTYGGLTNDINLLNDFWMFNIQEQRWMEIKNERNSDQPGFLSGHSLTLVKIADRESFILIGGYSNDTNSPSYNLVWEYSFDKGWKKLNTTGVGPAVVFGHSTVYHSPTQVLYVFAGYQMVNEQVKISNKLYSLSYKKELHSWNWSVLPGFAELTRPEEFLPRSRFLHSAISFAQFMIIYGGESQPSNSSDYLNAYVYKCNSWIRMTENVEIIGKPSDKLTFAQAVAVDLESDVNHFYLVGGSDSAFSISKVSVPSDICTVWSHSKFLCRLSRGCSFGSLTNNSSKTTFCMSSDEKENRKIELASTFNRGSVCDSELLAQRNCSTFETCSECEAVWPSESQSSCRWCKGDLCSKSKRCQANIPTDDEILNATIPSADVCPSVNCSSVDCDSCLMRLGCNWTRTEEKFSCLPNETVQRDNLEVLTECPRKCASFTDCGTCLSSSTFEGGFSDCVWSTRMSRCLSPSYKSLICSGANCGLLLTKNESNQCPLSCESYTMCSKCLQNAQCGWCANENDTESGDGACIEGNLEQPFGEDAETSPVCKTKYEITKNVTTTATFTWNFLTCPPENECFNHHHTCNNKTEKCVDLRLGFSCECADGYNQQSEDSTDCQPICPLGCVHGVCVDPDVCKCDFGYVGSNCSIQCLCSGHSNCAGPDQLDVCSECMNNTIGKNCEKCDKFFVGDPKNNGKCVSCLEYCNGHTDLCVAEMNESYANLSRTELEAVLTEGARSNAICMNCTSQTDGPRCETCLSGFFRGTTNLKDVCRKCQCNGHGDTCDPLTGEKCNCGDNSENDNTCPAKLDKNSIYRCSDGCSKCKESYSGHPKNAHQCYKHITIDSRMCLDAKPLDECKVETVPLKSGKTVFFVIQPRFMNVDIRIILDVTQGDIDFFMASNDDSFVVLTNHSNGLHEILLDSKYQWIQEIDADFDYTENLNITPLVTSSKKSFDNVSIPHGFTDDRGSLDCRSFGKFHVLDKVAHSLSTHITLNRCNTLLRVFGLKNRLVVTLPQNIHNLSGTRFFIALRAANHATVTGLLFFRQDQLHIDLFVFFSVFFSCFFLFLSACVVFWKIKQGADMRRARRRHVVEMMNMAQRAFSSVILDASNESQSQKTIAKGKTATNKKDSNFVVGIETTSNGQAAVCTVFIRLPGHRRSVCLGSSLIAQPKPSMFLNKASPRISQQVV